MSARAKRPIVHEFVDGRCVVCGDTQEWIERDGSEL